MFAKVFNREISVVLLTAVAMSLPGLRYSGFLSILSIWKHSFADFLSNGNLADFLLILSSLIRVVGNNV